MRRGRGVGRGGGVRCPDATAEDGGRRVWPTRATMSAMTAPDKPEHAGSAVLPDAAPPATPATDPDDGHPHGKTSTLALAALGVVFGDIGTSPLYALQTVFSIEHNAVQPTREDVFGVISMVFWSITIIVSFKYVFLVMRADNDGEGGILSLVALLRRKLGDRPRLARIATAAGHGRRRPVLRRLASSPRPSR